MAAGARRDRRAHAAAVHRVDAFIMRGSSMARRTFHTTGAAPSDRVQATDEIGVIHPGLDEVDFLTPEPTQEQRQFDRGVRSAYPGRGHRDRLPVEAFGEGQLVGQRRDLESELAAEVRGEANQRVLCPVLPPSTVATTPLSRSNQTA